MNKKVLTEMLEELKKAPEVYQPSNYWIEAGRTHTQRLFSGGLDNFKRSINLKYFNWGILGILRHQLSPILLEMRRRNFAPIFESHFINPRSEMRFDKESPNLFLRIIYAESFGIVSALIYKIFIASLWEYVSREDILKILSKIEEPLIGNPFLVAYKKRSLSQDLCNSVHEFYSITKEIDLNKRMDVAEIGAGYGRLAYVFLKAIPKISYTIIDIPPALFISQDYLSKVFFGEKIFYFRPFGSFKKVKNEFESAKIRFLMAHQIEYLPEKYFDHILTVSSFHEMTRKQIRNYIAHVDRLTKGYFYTKQWLRSRTKDNDHITQKEYPIPKKWRTIFQRHHPIQSTFFEALYKMSSQTGP